MRRLECEMVSCVRHSLAGSVELRQRLLQQFPQDVNDACIPGNKAVFVVVNFLPVGTTAINLCLTLLDNETAPITEEIALVTLLCIREIDLLLDCICVPSSGTSDCILQCAGHAIHLHLPDI